MLFLSVFAIEPISVNFQEHSENDEIAGILSALDASQVAVTLYADSSEVKNYEIWMVERCGSDLNRRKIGYKQMKPDSTKITFTAIPKDSLNVDFSFIRLSGIPRIKVTVPAVNHLLIGCDYKWKFSENDTIPLVAYATGIVKKFDFGNGQILDGFDICGLRFSKVKPYDWKEKYGLDDYIYFEAVPVK